MKIKLFGKVLRQAKYELGRLSVFGTENGRVYRLRYPVGREWVYSWMFGKRLDIYENLGTNNLLSTGLPVYCGIAN